MMTSTFPGLRTVTAGAFALLALAACGENGGGAGPTPGVAKTPTTFGAPAADRFVFDVAWKPETVQATAADVATLKNPRAKDGRLRFDPAPAAITAAPPGAPLLLPGVGLFKIKAVAKDGAAVVVDTEPGSLLEAAQRGHIGWDFGVEGGRKPSYGLKPLAIQVADPQGRPVMWMGSVGDLSAELTITPADGPTQIALTATYGGGGGELMLSAQGTLAGFRSTGDYQFADGAIQRAQFDTQQIDLDLTATITMRALGAGNGVAYKLPVAMSYPFAVGPLPMYISMGVEFALQSTLAAMADVASVAGHFHVVGAVGFGSRGGGFAVTSANLTGDPALDQSEQHASISTGIELLLTAPEIEVGAGLPPEEPGSALFGAGLYLKLEHELVTNFEIRRNLGTGETRSCIRAAANAAAVFGGEARLLGFALSRETTFWSRTNAAAPQGNGCP